MNKILSNFCIFARIVSYIPQRKSINFILHFTDEDTEGERDLFMVTSELLSVSFPPPATPALTVLPLRKALRLRQRPWVGWAVSGSGCKPASLLRRIRNVCVLPAAEGLLEGLLVFLGHFPCSSYNVKMCPCLFSGADPRRTGLERVPRSHYSGTLRGM